MTTEIPLLPLPEWMSRYTIPADGFAGGEHTVLIDRMQAYARANVARATEALQAENAAIRREMGAMRRALSRILENEASDYKAAEEFGGYVLDDELREEARAALE